MSEKEPIAAQESAPKAEKPYNREAKLKELLAQDEERSPYVDDFMGF